MLEVPKPSYKTQNIKTMLFLYNGYIENTSDVLNCRSLRSKFSDNFDIFIPKCRYNYN
jgi:hypothetical protein